MKRSTCISFTIVCLVLVPTAPACSITDIAGNADAGVGGAQATGGATGSIAPSGGVSAGTGGASEAPATGGAATGGAATTSAPAATGGSTGTTLPTWPTPDGCVTGNENPLFVGTWEGYVQGSPIGDEKSSLRLNILGANSNGLCGTLTVGTHTEPVTFPAATDPTAWYPPTFSPDELRSGSFGPILGYVYTVLSGEIAGQRTTFDVSYREIFNTWCELQTSYAKNLAYPEYGCLPANSGGYLSNDPADQCYISLMSGERQYVPCAQGWLCRDMNSVCSCTSAGCTAASGGLRFDLLFNGNQAAGTFGSDNVVFNRITHTQQ